MRVRTLFPAQSGSQYESHRIGHRSRHNKNAQCQQNETNQTRETNSSGFNNFFVKTSCPKVTNLLVTHLLQEQQHVNRAKTRSQPKSFAIKMRYQFAINPKHPMIGIVILKIRLHFEKLSFTIIQCLRKYSIIKSFMCKQ